MGTQRRLRSYRVVTAQIVAAGALMAFSDAARATGPVFSLDPASPTLAAVGAATGAVLSPAVVPVPGTLPPPTLGVPAAALGIAPGDVVRDFAFGTFPVVPVGLRVLFSVDAATLGAPAAPMPANVACEAAGGLAAADVFRSHPFGPPLPLPNVLAFDANGAADAACPPPATPGLGLIEPGDNVVGLEMCPASFVFAGGVVTKPVYFTLAAGSPTLIALGATAADVLVQAPPGFAPPAVFLPAAAFGLVGGPPGCGAPACDEIDALELNPVLGFGVVSLAPGSPSLAACGFTAADLFALGSLAGCIPIASAAALGLAPGDNIDAAAVNIDTDGDAFTDLCDNCAETANPDQADTDADGTGDACDSADLCPLLPSGACADAGRSILVIKDRDMNGGSAGDAMLWKWLKGPAAEQDDFGDPTATTDYSVCVYDATGGVGEFDLSGGDSLWSSLGDRGYVYKDPSYAYGVGRLLLRGGPAGTSSIQLKAKGDGLPFSAATLPLDTSADVRVQIHNGDNANCWESVFPPASVDHNTETLFKAKSP